MERCSERPAEVSPEGGEGDDEAHLHHGRRGRRPQPNVDAGRAGEEAGEDLLDDDVAGQEHGDEDTQQQQDVGPQRLGSGSHELRVIDTEQQQGGEEGKEATIEHLNKSHNSRSPVSAAPFGAS